MTFKPRNQAQDLRHLMKTLNYRIIGLFIFIVTSWGIAWPINKVGLAYITPAWYTAIRLFIGSVCMLLLVGFLGKLSLPNRKDYPLILIIGLLQISLYILLTNLGLAYLPAGRASLLAYTTPLWVMPAATFIFHEEAGPTRWIGFLLGIGGLFLLLNPWEIDWQNSDVIFGTAMLLLASLCWGISILAVRYMRWTKSPLELMPWQLMIGTFFMIIYAWQKEPLVTFHWPLPLILSLLYTGILVTGFSYWAGIVINKALPTIIVSLGFLAVPVFSLMISGIFMHEVIDLSTITSMLLIILGLFCVVI